MSSVPGTAVVPINAGDAASAIRQWAFFPSIAEGEAKFASPQTFRLLVESIEGRLTIATVTLRTAPDIFLVANLARLVDERPFALASRERINGEFEARHGLALEVLDLDLDTDNPLELTAAIPRAIARAARQLAKPGPTTTSLSELRASITEQLAREWESTQAKFISNLTTEAVAQARAIDGLRPSSYNFLNTVTAEQRRNRSQAMAAFPWLQPVLMTPQLNWVRREIDAGGPLLDVLGYHYGASKAMLRTLRKVVPDDLGFLAKRIGILVKLLREIPADWWPRNPLAWRQFVGTASTISRMTRQPITTATNLLWLRRCAKDGYQLSGRTPEDLVRQGQNIDEFMDALLRALFWVLHDRNDTRHVPRTRPLKIASKIKGDLGLDKLSQVASRFGDAYRRAVAEFADEAELWLGVRWPAIGEGPREYGDIVIHPLLTPADLKEEGAQMGNCVAGYVEYCMKAKSQIWSVRHCNGQRLSTLETRFRAYPDGRKVLEVEQHKGIRNGAAPEVTWKAVGTHVAYFSDSPEHMQSYLNWRQNISRKPLGTRQQFALMQPIVTALERTLPGKWSWQLLVTAMKSQNEKLEL